MLGVCVFYINYEYLILTHTIRYTMSENNINNFKTLIEQKRIIKKAIAKSLLAFGAPDNKAVSQYRPVGILWDDLREQMK